MTSSRFNRSFLASMAVVCLLAACGAEQLAGIQGSGSPAAAGYTTVGPVDGFGSIFVDGVEYTTSGAQIRIDDQPAAESQLKVGEVVIIKGSVSADGTATVAAEVSFAPDLRGAVTQIDLERNTFTVLGQAVQVIGDTLFGESIQPAELAGLKIADFVEVSGFADAAGNVVASRIDLVSAGAPLQVKGTVQALDATTSTFRINTLTVDYSGISPTGSLTNAATVIVRGANLNGGGALVATSVQVIAGLAAAANDRGKLEGIVTSFTSTTDFAVSGQRVVTDGSTQFVLRGLTLALNVPVKVSGTFDASGALVASKVDVKLRSFSLVRGFVNEVSAAAGTLKVLYIPVTTDSSTSLEDRSTQQVRLFQLEDVSTGDYVEVRGTPNPAGPGLLASLVLRDRPENSSYLQGVALNVLKPNLTILGTVVTTNSQTQFLGLGGTATAADTFFSQAAGRKVQVRGELMGGIFTADRVQIQPY